MSQIKRTIADKYFSEYIRLRFAVNGIVSCYTCGKLGHWRNMDCGHYIKRQYMNLRFNEINCQVQCKHCNYYLQGNDARFRDNLIKEYGENVVMSLESSKKTIRKHTDYEIKAISGLYKKLVKKLKENN